MNEDLNLREGYCAVGLKKGKKRPTCCRGVGWGGGKKGGWG